VAPAGEASPARISVVVVAPVVAWRGEGESLKKSEREIEGREGEIEEREKV